MSLFAVPRQTENLKICIQFLDGGKTVQGNLTNGKQPLK